MAQSVFSLIDPQYVRSLCDDLEDDLSPSSPQPRESRFAPLSAPIAQPVQAVQPVPAGLDEDTDPSVLPSAMSNTSADDGRARHALHTLKSLLGATGQLHLVDRLEQSMTALLDASGATAGFLSDDAGLALLDTNINEEFIIMGATIWSSIFDWHLNNNIYGHYAVMQTGQPNKVLHLFCFTVDVGRFILGLVAPNVFHSGLFDALSDALDAPVMDSQQLQVESYT